MTINFDLFRGFFHREILAVSPQKFMFSQYSTALVLHLLLCETIARKHDPLKRDILFD